MTLLTMRLILIHGSFGLILCGNAIHHNSLWNLDTDSNDKLFNEGLNKSEHENYKNASSSVTYISTYSLPIIWSSHHVKKLHEKIRKNRSHNFNRIRPKNAASDKKVQIPTKSTSDVLLNSLKKSADIADWKDLNANAKEVQLPIEKMFLAGEISEKNELTRFPTEIENSIDPRIGFAGSYKNISKISKRKKKKTKRKGLKGVNITSDINGKSVHDVAAVSYTSEQNNSINANSTTDYDSSNAISLGRSESSDVGESRTISLILFMNAIFIPTIILEILTIGAFIFVSPVLGLGLLLVTIVGAILSGFAFLFII